MVQAFSKLSSVTNDDQRDWNSLAVPIRVNTLSVCVCVCVCVWGRGGEEGNIEASLTK